MLLALRVLFVVCFVAVGNANYCRNALMEGSLLSASSEDIGKGAKYARLHGASAWTALFATASQYLTVDLRGVYSVEALASQGQAGSQQWISAYHLQYGFNGRDFSTYYGVKGGAWEFAANSDGDSVVLNELQSPIVARYIRIRPVKWSSRISMRVELYGCAFSGIQLGFDGKSLAEKNLAKQPIHSVNTDLNLRFKTAESDGVLLYSRGSQTDLLSLYLMKSRLFLTLSLGGEDETVLSLGSLLDDDTWHQVTVRRRQRHVTLIVDRVRVQADMHDHFTRLDLDNKLYVGGVPHVQPGLGVLANFSGCLENVFLDQMDFISEVLDRNDGLSNHGASSQCPVAVTRATPAITFTSARSQLVFDLTEGSSQLNVSFSFRTFETGGVLMYHRFASMGHVRVRLHEGELLVQLNGEDMPREVELRPFGQRRCDDGVWHDLTVTLSPDSMITVLDRRPMITRRLIKFRIGSRLYFAGAGSEIAYPGYIGCMRSFASGEFERISGPWKKENVLHSDEVVEGACQLLDRCSPNPCHHGGACSQSGGTFTCDCSNTGYGGAVCYTASHPVSCSKYFMSGVSGRRAQVTVDVDGSGGLAPFPVVCVRRADQQVETHVAHRMTSGAADTGGTGSGTTTGDSLLTVDGFNQPGSYMRHVQYSASDQQLERLMNASLRCQQRLEYVCRGGARLLNTGTRTAVSSSSSSAITGPLAGFEPFGWWVSRDNRVMDYWAGAQPGSRQCGCGVDGSCVDPAFHCNCDAGYSSEQRDGGVLTDKMHLPVRELRFGDTGSLADGRNALYRLGSLVCEGDAIFNNTVTFRYPDATVDLSDIQLGYSFDFYFEFRTAQTSATFLHMKGPHDYVEVSMKGGVELKLSLSISGYSYEVLIASSGRLNNDLWHAVLVEVNDRQARLVLDDASSSTSERAGGAGRLISLSSRLVVGARTTYHNGYVGCMRAFSVNGRLQNLMAVAQRGMFGLSAGCVGKCASNPCLNGGHCIEAYSTYTCNCRLTAFKGPICADEIGVSMTRDYMIEYRLDSNVRSTVEERIRIGFTTTNPSGFLIGLFGDKKEYMTVEVSNSGHISVVFDVGFERQEVVYPATNDRVFNQGQFHDVLVERIHGGKAVRIQVDRFVPLVKHFNLSFSSDVQFEGINRLYIGKNTSMTEGFVGCISRVEFDDVFPLKEMFQEDKPGYITGNRDTIHEDYCGVEPQRHAAEPIEKRPPPEVDQSLVDSLQSRFNTPLFAGLLAAVLFVVCVVAVLVCRYAQRHKGDYLTREDSGASGAEDAHEAVTQSRTGHQVDNMKEFFI